MATTTFTGIGSGIDFNTLIDQAVEAEKAPITALQTRKTTATKQASIVGDLITKLKALDLKLKELDTPAELFGTGDSSTAVPTVKQAFSSDEKKVLASATSAASTGSYTIQTLELSGGQVNRSIGFSANEAGAVESGSLGITVGDNARVDVSFTFNDSLSDVVDKINSSGAKVQASLANDGSAYRIVITGEPGDANAVQFDTLAGPDLGFSTDQVQAAHDARFTVDGVEYRSASNTVSDAIKGVTFQLLSPTSSDVNLTVASVPDSTSSDASSSSSSALSKIQSLVSAYNDVMKAIQAQLTDDQSGNTNKLFGDLTIQGLQRSLGIVTTNGIEDNGSRVSLASIGLSVGRDGSITLDASKLTTALQDDATTVQNLFYGADGKSGFAAGLSSLIDRFTSSSDGLLLSKQSSLNQQSKNFDDQIERIETKATDLGDRLRKQFTALDSLMVDLNNQTTYISALFSSQS